MRRLAAPPADEARPSLSPGELVDDRYRVVKKLGEGGMGEVYEVEHVRIARRLALKCMRRELAGDREAMHRFEAEARAATRIGSEHIVEVTDLGDLPDGRAYMCMELLEGRTWADELAQEGPQSLGQASRVIHQLCDALIAAHAEGVVHRDLKPENVFLVRRDDEPRYVKLTDFGVAKMLVNHGMRLTSTGIALGTPHYMAPEQATGAREVDHRVDVYALGVMLYQALTGTLPYDAPNFVGLVTRICTEPVPDVRVLRPELSREVSALLATALDKNPDTRFASCAALKTALLAVNPR